MPHGLQATKLLLVPGTVGAVQTVSRRLSVRLLLLFLDLTVLEPVPLGTQSSQGTLPHRDPSPSRTAKDEEIDGRCCTGVGTSVCPSLPSQTLSYLRVFKLLLFVFIFHNTIGLVCEHIHIHVEEIQKQRGDRPLLPCGSQNSGCQVWQQAGFPP